MSGSGAGNEWSHDQRGGQGRHLMAGRGLCIQPHLPDLSPRGPVSAKPRERAGSGHQHRRVSFQVTFYILSLKSEEESHSCQALVMVGLFSKGPKRGLGGLLRKFQISNLEDDKVAGGHVSAPPSRPTVVSSLSSAGASDDEVFLVKLFKRALEFRSPISLAVSFYDPTITL